MKLLDDIKIQINTYYDDIVIFLPKLMVAIVMCTIAYLVLQKLRTKLGKVLVDRADDKLLANFTNSIFRIINVIVIVLMFLYIVGLGKIATNLLGAAGISAFVIGFALKDIGENFLAGVIMAFDRPFRLGDTIKTGDVEGTITEMSLRDTHVKTFDGKDVYIPNGQFIKNPLYNYTIDGYLRKSFSVGLDYGSDIDQARKIAMDSIASIPGILITEKPPSTLINRFDKSSINLTILYWINTFDSNYSGIEVHTQAMQAVLSNLTKAGINIPGDVLELKNYNNQTIKTEA